MRWLLYAAAGLVFLAGVQLFILTEQTASYFAWTVAPPFTAAFLGAAYWAAVPVELIAARATQWAGARVAVPGIWLFTTLTLVATLLHFDRFHFSSSALIPQAAAWLWLAIYTVVPVAILLVGYYQIRIPGRDPIGTRSLPPWLRFGFIVTGGGMLVAGLALFATPTTSDPYWPWTLTPLTSQAIGAWFLGTGLAAVYVSRENDMVRGRPIGAGYTVFAVLELIALARYGGELAWHNPGTWVYLAFLVALLPIGLSSWFASRDGPGLSPSSTDAA